MTLGQEASEALGLDFYSDQNSLFIYEYSILIMNIKKCLFVHFYMPYWSPHTSAPLN